MQSDGRAEIQETNSGTVRIVAERHRVARSLRRRDRPKIVHVPCCFGRKAAFDAVQVFTLGEASWRSVPAAAGSRCLLYVGVESVDGATYWVSRMNRVMCFDLREESLTYTQPRHVLGGRVCRLTDVHGSPAIVSTDPASTLLKSTEIWVLDGRGQQKSWIHQHSVQVLVHSLEGHRRGNQQLTLPYFAHGNYFLTSCLRDQTMFFYRHKIRWLPGGKVRIKEKNKGTMIAKIQGRYLRRTLVYVETSEPLSFDSFGA